MGLFSKKDKNKYLHGFAKTNDSLGKKLKFVTALRLPTPLYSWSAPCVLTGRWPPVFLVEPRGSLTNDKSTQQGPALPSCFQPRQCPPGVTELDLGKGRGGQAG